MGAARFERAGRERCEETDPGAHAEHGRGWFRTSDLSRVKRLVPRSQKPHHQAVRAAICPGNFAW